MNMRKHTGKEKTMTGKTIAGVELEYREGASDKVYKVEVVESGSGYRVDFAYGRRGSALSAGTKTHDAVPLEQALRIYNRLVKSKTAKGYVEAVPGTAAATSMPKGGRRDTGLRSQLLNAITRAEALALLACDNWCVQEKHDGRRLMIRKTGSDVVAANRNGMAVSAPEAVIAELKTLPCDFVGDGECVGEVWHVFDVLELDGVNFRERPYRDRLRAAETVFGAGVSARAVATATGRAKAAAMAGLESRGREGAVFKDMDSAWNACRPNTGGSALKLKFWNTCSCVVAKANAGRRSVALELGGTGVGNVTVPPNAAMPEPGAVVEIRYLYVQGPRGRLYQPLYMGERDDIGPESCTFETQKLKRKAA